MASSWRYDNHRVAATKGFRNLSVTHAQFRGSREIKTYFEYHLEHWAHVEPFPFAPVDVVGLNGLPPGVVTARWDIVREYGWAQAPSSELAQYEGRVHPEYGQVWPASPYGTWTKSYVSGQSLGIAVTAFGYQLEGKTYFNTGTKLEHTFSGKYDRYWGYDRNTGGKEWFFSHS